MTAAERRVDAATAAMLINVGPILIAILAAMFVKEGFPRAEAAERPRRCGRQQRRVDRYLGLAPTARGFATSA